MHHRGRLVLLHRLDEGGEVAHVLAGEFIIGLAKLEAQKGLARLGIEEHDLLAALERMAGEGGANEACAGDERGHA